MKDFFKKGLSNYIYSSLLFGFALVGMSISFIRHGLYFLIIFPLGMAGLVLILISFNRRYVKDKIDPLKSKDMKTLLGAYLFTWLGLSFLVATLAYIPPGENIFLQGFIPSIICTIIGTATFIVFFRSYLQKKKKNVADVEIEEKREGCLTKIVIFAVIMGLLPVTAVGIAALSQGSIVGGIIFLAIPTLFGVVFYFVRKANKKK